MEASQSNAWIVPVKTKPIGSGGNPMTIYYIAGVASAHEAVEAVKAKLEHLEGEDVRDPSPISSETAKSLGVRPGLVLML